MPRYKGYRMDQDSLASGVEAVLDAVRLRLLRPPLVDPLLSNAELALRAIVALDERITKLETGAPPPASTKPPSPC